ncbi:hypothetical protein NP493_115g15016 [Ridgeia piscesae]|uniref:Uncharacterized protein n=1 Tax=Ridgeia piscesae TaxID=27915 RepID=A0AAD9P6L5_RIDPI|nr:hypothetical protein NP493_115g15016 [Ridgeia piscesae]
MGALPFPVPLTGPRQAGTPRPALPASTTPALPLSPAAAVAMPIPALSNRAYRGADIRDTPRIIVALRQRASGQLSVRNVISHRGRHDNGRL